MHNQSGYVSKNLDRGVYLQFLQLLHKHIRDGILVTGRAEESASGHLRDRRAPPYSSRSKHFANEPVKIKNYYAATN
jgi:hypothetical protein